MTKDVDIAREHNFITDILINLQTKEKDSRVQKELLLKFETFLKHRNLNLAEEKTQTISRPNVKLNKKILHTPIVTSNFLKKFKFREHEDNRNSGLKELVHSPTDPNYSINDFKMAIDNALITLHQQWLPFDLYHTVHQLIQLMNKEGLAIYEKEKVHPFNFKMKKKLNDDALKRYSNLTRNNQLYPYIQYIIKGFKQNYRCADESSEATVLQDLIRNIFQNKYYQDVNLDLDYKYTVGSTTDENEISLTFSDNFNNEAMFFTWIPNIKPILYKMAEDFLKYRGDKRNVAVFISSSYDEIRDIEKIDLHILNEGSYVKATRPIDIYNSFKEDFEARLISVCDWRIEFDYLNGESKRIVFCNENTGEIMDCDRVGGFKHILTFYN
jgi:hypothetical protein